ncbi:MAG: hypothetical protein GDA56_33560 [Hormoscilla sp. GM7CHS1pb]|nr:hypothetical protein [Hormoscilla sp. GM7CHS1pb]
MNSIIDQAVQFLTTASTTAPAPSDVVEALLEAEKTAKQTKAHYTYSQLLDTWRLGFITGTKKSRQRAGVILGAGRFLPKLVKILLSYSSEPEPSGDRGKMENSVEVGLFKIAIAGPAQFLPQRNILTFDFTRMQLYFLGMKLYQSYIRSGKDREAQFYQKTVKDRAFFTYFLVDDRAIAARGRGGGLALWTRVGQS